jgi:hypothetical protein
MISNDEQLHQAQADIQTIWRFLEAAREAHAPLDYQRLAAPYLLQLQERQQEVVEYLSRQPALPDTASA